MSYMQIVQTPNIDAFAREGVRFTNAFAQASVCSQSRCSMVREASLLLGSYRSC